jgi:hypothetical protein
MLDPARASAEDVAGMWRISLDETRRGWPAIASIEREAPEISIDILGERAPRTALPEGDPIRRAIEVSLRQEGPHELLDALDSRPRTRVIWYGWLASALMWWVALTLLIVFTLTLAEYAWRIRRARLGARGAERAATGLCPACGYDMRGLEFSERCPECGALVS